MLKCSTLFCGNNIKNLNTMTTHSTSETGYAKNIANFSKSIIEIQSLGAAYNPVASEIKIPALQTQETAIASSVTTLHSTEPVYREAINNREIPFDSMSKYTTRIARALKAAGATAQEIKDVESYKKKIQGIRVTPIKTVTPTPATTPATDPALTAETTKIINQHSSSQMSYEYRVENFKKLIAMLSVITKYNPNETDLKIAALNTYAASLDTLNKGVNTAFAPFANARIARDKLLYAPTTGAHDLLQQVKDYIISIYGDKSPQYKLFSGLYIRNPRK